MQAEAAEEIITIKFKGPLARFMRDRTRFIDLEGALNSGKTTACLTKEFLEAWHQPGIWSFIGRFSDGDNDTKLIPAWEAVVEKVGAQLQWNAEEKYYAFPNGPDARDPYKNGSRVYSFGLMSPVPMRRYAKIRGLGVSRIYIDQAEELPPDFFGELVLRMRQQGFDHQFTISPNPMDENAWHAAEFPVDNNRPNRAYYSLSVYDNAHNLPPETLEDVLSTYPVTHASHRSKVLGQRGLNVVGKPVYGGAFTRSIHVRPLSYNQNMPLEIGFDFGKHHPCALFRQRTPYGGVHYLGGLMGQSVFLEDFLPIVHLYLRMWFGDNVTRMECCDPAGSHNNSQGVKINGVSVLKSHGFNPKWIDGSNRPSVRSALVETIAGQMRKRTPMGEAYGVNSDKSRWLRVTADGRPPAVWEFMADGDEAGYVWNDHEVSEGSKKYRVPKKDGWYEHGQNAREYLELNFGGVPKKEEAPAVRRQRPRSQFG